MSAEIEDDEEDVVVLTVEEGQEDRIDRYLAGQCPELSRTRLKQLIIEGAVSVNDNPAQTASRKVQAGDVLTLIVPPPVDDTPVPEDIPLEILFEDAEMLVINKAAGMVVHPAPGHRSGTLVNALLYHCGESLSGIGGVRRPGIVHRLDKDTSGVMLVAKTDRAHKKLSSQLARRTLSRRYQALVWGVPNILKGKVDAPVGRHHAQRLKMAVTKRQGRSAVTRYERVKAFGSAASLLICTLETGRTHQIRVHMDHLGFPVIGDPAYRIQQTKAQSLLRKDDFSEEATTTILEFPRQALHAWQLQFIHPASEELMSFEAPLPDDMQLLLKALESPRVKS